MRNLKLSFPFWMIPALTPLYLILDSALLVKVFGCGCVPEAKTNMLNVALNANDLKRIVFAVLVVLVVFLAVMFSRDFEKKLSRVFYCIGVFVAGGVANAPYWLIMMWR